MVLMTGYGSCRLHLHTEAMHTYDEQHCVLDCSLIDDLRSCNSRRFYGNHGPTRLLMWHPNQKGGAPCLWQVLDGIEQHLTQTHHSDPSAMLAGGTSFNLASPCTVVRHAFAIIALCLTFTFGSLEPWPVHKSVMKMIEGYLHRRTSVTERHAS